VTVSQWAPLMESTVIVFAPTTAALSAFGAATYATAGTTYSAHVQEGSAKMRTRDGTEVTVGTVAYVASTSTSAITERSKVRLGDGSTPSVAAVQFIRDENGVHHTKLGLG